MPRPFFVEASESTLLCARRVAPPAPHQSKQSSAHEQKACWFRNNGVLDNRATETSRVLGAQEEAEGSGHEYKGTTSERICCREWPAVGGRRRSRGICSTGTGNTPRKRIRKKRPNIDSLVGDRRGIVGDENVGGVGSEPGAQRHSRCPAQTCLKPIRQRVADRGRGTDRPAEGNRCGKCEGKEHRGGSEVCR